MMRPITVSTFDWSTAFWKRANFSRGLLANQDARDAKVDPREFFTTDGTDSEFPCPEGFRQRARKLKTEDG